MTCVYGPAVAYAFQDPLLAAYRHSAVHVSLIRVLDGTALNWCRQEDLRARMSETVLLGKIKDPELTVLNFRGQLQSRMGGKQEGPIEIHPKFCNLNPVFRNTSEVLRISAWTKSFEFTKRELETIIERDVLPAKIPEFATLRRMTLGLKSPIVVPSLHARAALEQQHKMFTDSWDPLYIWYSAVVYFPTCETKINSDHARKEDAGLDASKV